MKPHFLKIEAELHCGAFAFVLDKKVLHISQNTYDEHTGTMQDFKIALPSCPKWMLDSNGKRIRFPANDNRVLVPVSEIFVELPTLRFENLRDRRRAFCEISQKCAKRDLKMKCEWIYKVYRQRETVIKTSKGGCLAFMELGVVGGYNCL